MADVRSTNRFPVIAANMRPAAHQLVQATCANIFHRVVASMSDKNPPSLPGTPPAVRTGYLRASYNYKMMSELVGVVYATADYAPHLEFGTIFMAARPALGPAVNEEKPKFLAALRVLMAGGAAK